MPDENTATHVDAQPVREVGSTDGADEDSAAHWEAELDAASRACERAYLERNALNEPADLNPPRRAIRSFVMRAGRTTAGQSRALEELWPRHGVPYSPDALDLSSLFGREAPRTLEIGFGNGEHLANLAQAHPERDYLGIEVHRPGVGHLLMLAQSRGLTNVRVSDHDAVEVLTHQLPVASLDEVLVLFPDPWHKKRHHKRRLIQPPFVELIASRLKSGGVFKLATDWEEYAQQMLSVLRGAPTLFTNLSDSGDWMPRPEERAPTRFEKRGARLGHGVWDLAFRRS